MKSLLLLSVLFCCLLFWLLTVDDRIQVEGLVTDLSGIEGYVQFVPTLDMDQASGIILALSTVLDERITRTEFMIEQYLFNLERRE